MATDSPSAPPQALLKDLARLLPELNALRTRHLFFLYGGTGLFVVSIATAAFLLFPDRQFVYLVSILVPLSLSFALFRKLNGKYLRLAKEKLIACIAAASDSTHRESGTFSAGDADDHKILPPHGKARAGDGFEGRHGSVPFSLQDAAISNLKQTPRSSRHRRDMSSFSGMMAKIRMKRSFEGHTLVISHNAMQAFHGADIPGLQRVRLPSNKFEDLFDIFSSDPVEAKVILSPAFMERFLAIGKLLGAQWLAVSFLDDEVLLVVQRGRPMFDIGPLWQAVLPERLRQSAEGFEAVTRLIETLQANRQTRL